MSLPLLALALLAGAAPGPAVEVAKLLPAQADDPQLVVLPLEAEGVKPQLGIDAWKVVVAEVQKAKAKLKVGTSAQQEIHDIILGPAREQARDCGANLECLREIGSAIDAGILVAGKVTKDEVSLFALDVSNSQKLASGKSAAKEAGAKLEAKARSAAQSLITALAAARAKKKPDAVAEATKTDDKADKGKKGGDKTAEKTDKADKAEKTAEKTDKADKAEKTAEPIADAKSSKSDAGDDDLKSDSTPPVGKADKSAKADKADKGAKADKNAKADKADKNAKPDKADKNAKADDATAKADKNAKPDKGAKGDKNAKVDDEPAKADKGAKADALAGDRGDTKGGMQATDAKNDDLKLPSDGTIHASREVLARVTRLEIDGAPITRTVDGTATWTGAPGSHVIVAERDDGARVTKNVVVDPGRTVELALDFPGSTLVAEGPPPAKRDEGSVTDKWWFWTAIAGAVVVGGATTVIFAGGLKGGPDVPSSYGAITGTY